MFIEIIEETGILLSVKGGSSGSHLVIGADRILEDVKRRDSIAVSGVCLVTASLDSDFFLADVIPGTLKRFNLGYLSTKSFLNLERAMITDGRFGGHIASDHIDGAGTIVNAVRDGNALWYTIRSAPFILRRIIEKGPVVIDGVGLTVAQVRGRGSNISLIPHTASHATLGALRPGRVVNLGNDCVGKYIERFMKASPPTHGIRREDAKNRRTDSRIAPELLKQCEF